MPLPRPPGVYFEPADPPLWSIDETRTDIAGFVGVAERGPLHEPVRISSWTQFLTRFGRSRLPNALLPDAVRGFFVNGGRTAWVVRAGRRIGKCLHAAIELVNVRNEPVYRVWAKDPGLGGSAISVRILPAVQGRFHLSVEVEQETGGAREAFEVWRNLDSSAQANPSICKIINGPVYDDDRIPDDDIADQDSSIRQRDYSRDPRQRPPRANDSASVLIRIENVKHTIAVDRRVVGVLPLSAASQAGASTIPTQGRLGWGDEQTAIPRRSAKADQAQSLWDQRSVLYEMTLDHFLGDDENLWGLKTLETIDEVAVVAIPDLMWQPTLRAEPVRPDPCRRFAAEVALPSLIEDRLGFTATEQRLAQRVMIDHCARLKDRFAVLDAPYGQSPDEVMQWAANLYSYQGQFGALYYPWVGVPTAADGVNWLPPSGHMAGLYARVDLSAGVQKPPANEILNEVQAVHRDIDSETHGALNLQGINVLRATAARGVRAMGARTLVPPGDPEFREWEFVSVRRLLLMLEESLDQATQWLVHGDNRRERWRDVERVVRNFLMRQWRRGRLDGTQPEEAFSVHCDETTNPAEEVAQGKMMCLIGVQPPQPAEFVLIRLGVGGGEAGAWNFGESRG